MRILGIIPVRFASTRFPGKPLAVVNGKTMVQRVYEQSTKSKSVTKVLVATDDDRIAKHAREIGAEVVMTSAQHQSGTDRCAEIIKQSSEQWDVVVNIQGDEPYIQPEQIDLLTSVFQKQNTDIATLVKKITTPDELFNKNNVKVVMNNRKEAIYFSRAPIPYNRNFPEQEWLKYSAYYKHIGIYGYRSSTLLTIAALPKTNLEITESLEQLRWIENGYKIMAEVTTMEAMSIDTPDDLLKVSSENK